MRRFILASILVLPAFAGFSQVQQSSLMVRNPEPRYRLSSDGKLLSVSLKSEDGSAQWCSFIDLSNMTWFGKAGSISTKDVTISSDMKSAYGTLLNFDGFKGNEHWLKYKRYISWYYPVSTSYENKMQWVDKNWVISAHNDGTVLTFGELEFKVKRNDGEPLVIMNDLNITDPKTGNTIRTLRKGKITEIWLGAWKRTGFWLTDNDKLLVWNGTDGLNTLRLDGGEQRKITLPGYDKISGRFVMHADWNNIVGNNQIRKSIYDIETGAVVARETILLKNATGFWCTSAGNNDFYTLNGLTSVLKKEVWNGTTFEVTDSVKLEIGALLPGDNWGATSKDDYGLLVSESTGHVLFLPYKYKFESTHIAYNNLLVWDLATGKLKYTNPNLIVPYESYLKEQERVSNTSPLAPLPYNALVRGSDGFYYVILSQHAINMTWSVIKFTRDRHGNYSRENQERPQKDFSNFTTPVISTITCPHCHGGGTTSVQEQRTSEKTDKMIYTQITTTTTQSVQSTSTCPECKGLGFSF
jgi:hypothetical protein